MSAKLEFVFCSAYNLLQVNYKTKSRKEHEKSLRQWYTVKSLVRAYEIIP